MVMMDDYDDSDGGGGDGGYGGEGDGEWEYYDSMQKHYFLKFLYKMWRLPSGI